MPGSAYFVLFVLFLLRLVDQNQKQALGFLYGYQAPVAGLHPPSFYSIPSEYPAMKGLYGLLSGPAFSISNGIAGLYFGKIADKSNRSRLLAFAAIAWSLTSIATGSVNSFAVMCIMRFGLGVFQAATEPLIFSLIADTIPKKKLPTANSLIKAAPYAGSAISSLLILMIPKIGWRGCFNFMGGIGVLAGILALFTIEEPARGVLDADSKSEEA